MTTMTGVPALGWRRRHPVLSRLLLYATALGVVGGVGLLVLQRKREDRLDYLVKRLDGLGLVYVQDRTGETVLGVLDREFGDPDLPAFVRQRVDRVRGMVEMRKGRADEAEAAFARAFSNAEDPREREATRVEWAEARALLGRAERALDLLGEAPASQDVTLLLFRAQVRAFALERLGRSPEALGHLEATLAGLAAPLAEGTPLYLGLRPWSEAAAATEATEALARLAPGDEDARVWVRLVALAPRDFRTVSTAALSLAASGQESLALKAWRQARAIDARQAEILASRDPAAGALHHREELLKAEGAVGR
jgi:tetratricopeptide (TPR) repeat protein